jgi:hypothetical protein
MKNELLTYLCSVIVINEFHELLFEETFILGVVSESESEAAKEIINKMDEIQICFKETMSCPLFLSCHCIFPMTNDVMLETLSTGVILTMFPGLREWECS